MTALYVSMSAGVNRKPGGTAEKFTLRPNKDIILAGAKCFYMRCFCKFGSIIPTCMSQAVLWKRGNRKGDMYEAKT